MDVVGDIVARHAGREGPLLPILHDIQAALGCVGEDSIRAVAHALNLTRAEVHGVVSFYHDFRAEPERRTIVKLCRAEACQARGAEALFGTVADEGQVRIEPVYCLGLCSVGPAAMIGNTLHARLDETALRALVSNR
jgi:formate dehydrogenase subunit gamma